jgi:hypothetical protein
VGFHSAFKWAFPYVAKPKPRGSERNLEFLFTFFLFFQNKWSAKKFAKLYLYRRWSLEDGGSRYSTPTHGTVATAMPRGGRCIVLQFFGRTVYFCKIEGCKKNQEL